MFIGSDHAAWSVVELRGRSPEQTVSPEPGGDDAHAIMDCRVSISRQKGLVIVFVVHTLRKLDVALVLEADAVIYKELSFMRARLERREIRAMTQEALNKFLAILVPDRTRHAYVFSHEDWGAMLTNGLPEGWSDDLSRAFAGIDVEAGVTRSSKGVGIGAKSRISFQEKQKRPRELNL